MQILVLLLAVMLVLAGVLEWGTRNILKGLHSWDQDSTGMRQVT